MSYVMGNVEGQESVEHAHTRVMANDGQEAGFVVHGACSPAWDVLGRFLAVVTAPGLSVYSASGICVASLSGLPSLSFALPMIFEPVTLEWLAERGGLMVVADACNTGRHELSRYLLQFS